MIFIIRYIENIKIYLAEIGHFSDSNFWYGPCNLSLADHSNGRIYDLIDVEVFWIFNAEMENQKVVRLTTWIVESNSCFD